MMRTTRRDFLRITSIGTTALLLGVDRIDADARETWKPNPWLRIDPDGTITIIVGKQEMGQGVRTSIPMIVAEELDADWSKIRIEQASTGPEYTALNTGGSGSIYRAWRTLRPVAATAREMLILAAAAKWSVDRGSLRTENGAVLHDASGRRAHYGELTAAAAKLKAPENIAPKKLGTHRIVGHSMKRIDGPAIVSGKAKYGLDTRVDGMRIATVLRPPSVGGRVVSFDGTAAKKIRGVRDVIAISSGIAIVADSTWPAFKARDAVKVQWDDGPNHDFDSKKYIDQLTAAAAQSGTAMRMEGEAAKIFAAGGRELKATYVYPFYAHAPVEPMNTIASVRGTSCEIWSPTQAPNRVQQFVARHLGIAKENVVVHPTLIGGGFGRRLAADYAIEAAEISRAIGAPVQVVWTRNDDMHDSPLQHASVESMRGILDNDGNITAWSHTKITNAEMNISPPEPKPADLTAYYIDNAWGVYDIPYAIPNIATSYVDVPSPVRYGPWRSVYSPSSTMARECFFDELARSAGRDPLRTRLDLLADGKTIKTGDLTLDRKRLTRILEALRARSNWGKKLGTNRGQGMACNIYDGDTYLGYVVEVTADEKQWRVDRVICAVDCGVVINPNGVEQQIESGVIWALGQLMSEITIRGGRVEQSSYADYAVPRIADTPRIEVHILPNDRDGAFGMGEPPVPPFVPAVLNAIFDATGRRIRRLPVTM
jgi:isoquinoline 1-oxidoreductase subunit beta